MTSCGLPGKSHATFQSKKLILIDNRILMLDFFSLVYQKMYDASPISNADKIKAPILLLLGRDDHRVPPSQGLRWGQYLKGLGKSIRYACVAEFLRI